MPWLALTLQVEAGAAEAMSEALLESRGGLRSRSTIPTPRRSR